MIAIVTESVAEWQKEETARSMRTEGDAGIAAGLGSYTYYCAAAGERERNGTRGY